LTIDVVSAWQAAFAKQEEGIKQLKRVYLNVMDMGESFTTHTAERTPASGTFFNVHGVTRRVEVLAGDIM
jgi:hypothetical protein